MINIVYGTRAELIKFSPLIRELNRRKVRFRIIDIGQHDNTSLQSSLGIQPHFSLGKSYREIWSRLEAVPLTYPIAIILAMMWGIKVFFKLSNIIKKGDVVVIHGNTIGVPPTILATKIRNIVFPVKKKDKKVLVHMESGFRGNTRSSILLDSLYSFADRNSDVLFTPFRSTEKNLRKEGVSGKVIVSGDVIRDVVHQTLKIKPKIRLPKGNYVVANITRSVVNKFDARHLFNAIRDSPIQVVLIMNPVIERRLEKFGLLGLVNSKNILVMKPMNYPDFLHLLKGSKGAITDSGGVQEECAVLGKPCIVTNDYLQIKELEDFGIVKVAGCNYISILSGLKKIRDGRWKPKSKFVTGIGNPTKRIADYLVRMVDSP
jgi:UDP-N-acetylglucosamine 2-epimerase (non-hydrolysing)